MKGLLMSDGLRVTPARPCCDSCVLEALALASFDYSEPFVVYSGLRELSGTARRALVEQLIANATGEVALVVSAPVPAEHRESPTSPDGPAAEADDETGPSAEELQQILGVDDQSQGH
jgi:hypothetical protein